MVQCSVPKVLEYARRAVTVRRMALVLKIVSKIVRETYGIGAENRVENRAVMVQCSVPKVLEWDVWHWYGPMLRTKGARVCATGCDAENRVESRAVCLSWSNAPCSSMRDGL